MDVSAVEILVALPVGAGLGIWFFAGLLWTVRRLPTASHPLLLAAGSFIIRMVHSRSEERRVGKECRSRWSPYH